MLWTLFLASTAVISPAREKCEDSRSFAPFIHSVRYTRQCYPLHTLSFLYLSLHSSCSQVLNRQLYLAVNHCLLWHSAKTLRKVSSCMVNGWVESLLNVSCQWHYLHSTHSNDDRVASCITFAFVSSSSVIETRNVKDTIKKEDTSTAWYVELWRVSLTCSHL